MLVGTKQHGFQGRLFIKRVRNRIHVQRLFQTLSVLVVIFSYRLRIAVQQVVDIRSQTIDKDGDAQYEDQDHGHRGQEVCHSQQDQHRPQQGEDNSCRAVPVPVAAEPEFQDATIAIKPVKVADVIQGTQEILQCQRDQNTDEIHGIPA